MKSYPFCKMNTAYYDSFKTVDRNDSVGMYRMYFMLSDVCAHDKINELKYLFENEILTIDDFRMRSNQTFHTACKSASFNVVEYLVKVVGFTINDIKCMMRYDDDDRKHVIDQLDPSRWSAIFCTAAGEEY